MMKNKIRILHVAQAAGGVDRYIRMLLKYLDKEKFENILVCSQDFHEEDYRDLVDSFEQVEMTRAIGSSDLKAIKEVRALIKKYNPDNPMSYVELFDVACLLSRWEGFGLALPEYMMAGKPIVASRVDAIPNIIRNGENGLLVEVDDDIGASKAVLRILREDGLRKKIVAQGLEDVHNRFNARRVSEEHSKLFNKEMD